MKENVEILNGIDSGWRPWKRLLLVIVGAAFLATAFAPLNWSVVAWFGLAPLYVAGHRRTNRGLFFYGFVFGVVHYTINFAFLADIFFFCPLVAALLWAPIPGFWLLLVKRFEHKLLFAKNQAQLKDYPQNLLMNSRQVFLVVLAGGFYWAFFEWVRQWFVTGLPWDTLPISQVHYPLVLKSISLGGESLLSLCMSLVNCGVAVVAAQWILRRELGEKKSKLPWRIASLPGLVLTSFALGVGHWLHPKQEVKAHREVLLIQGNFPPYFHRISQEEYRKHLFTYRDLSLQKSPAGRDEPDLIVWPESCLIGTWQNSRDVKSLVNQVCRERQVPLLFGNSYDESLGQGQHTYNAALLVDQQGTLKSKYFKMHTVAYGEYMPFRWLLPYKWWQKLDEMRGMGTSLAAGTYPVVMDLGGGLRGGVNICFEDMFTDVSRQFVDGGANILFTLTNDSWFGTSSGGEAHTNHSILRAVENALPLVRCGNTCETMLVDGEGKVTDILLNEKDGTRFVRGALQVRVPVIENVQLTVYRRFPFLWPFILCLGVSAFFLFTLWKSYRFRLDLAAKIEDK